jgi:preprotein translocase subunit SecB
VMFLVEVQQAGIFRIRNIPQSDIEPVLGIGCPNILFPYLREAVSTVISHAGFPPVMLNPVNFETLYYQGKQQAEANGAVTDKTDGETKTTH